MRFNYLPKRWNLPAAQANVFVWGSVGRAHIGETDANVFAWNTGGQLDYETRQFYGSLRTELHQSSAYSHRVDTLQLGIAPYPHDIDTLAVWFVVQGRNYTNGLFDGMEWAGLLRLFKIILECSDRVCDRPRFCSGRRCVLRRKGDVIDRPDATFIRRRRFAG